LICFQDEDAIDKDGNDYEGEGSRPQKHAKSPELARDFLLDAATVIFKEQVYICCAFIFFGSIRLILFLQSFFL
jgi:hypothetical protein